MKKTPNTHITVGGSFKNISTTIMDLEWFYRFFYISLVHNGRKQFTNLIVNCDSNMISVMTKKDKFLQMSVHFHFHPTNLVLTVNSVDV